ncbi:acyl-CoA dehydrogenase [Altericroceibacterium spongiae]|uniref:3-methylmercaptopropionyl-CoA dehydrogenase n=1 Tax=Altericroceibacterium spongiae TaxID=2320269 RepID=A0A420ES06_9SPHN|nr:acyl-CoA dehydrogenase C-terminal domain-containing protein [Altericroceibacterium spongiae]RKF23504.1 acyl-CoA dehydrogenase [Altericroceibacterium spongiae]
MPSYTPPTRDTRFILQDLLRLDEYSNLPVFSAVDNDLIDTIIDEAGKFCAEVIAPLNPVADKEGCTWHEDGRVTTPTGFREAYAQYCEAGWGTLALPEEYGGQGMPHILATVFEEYLNSACHGFHMFPGLTHGAVSAILEKGTEEQKATYLPRLVAGEWLGTMALTEPHCGTDLGLIRTRAVPQDDGSYSITGTKIFISGGEQDLTENIVHLVLAKTPDAPEGSRGISLFIVPKFLVKEDGSLGERNPVTCGSIEEKMGLHGSATCVMNFDEAKGWIVGEENKGLAAMFIMMNAARLSCGNQGLGQASLAYQNAATYALDRRQGRASGERPDPSEAADPIIVHADVRRMLMDARGFIEGFRALTLWCALQLDLAHGAETEEERNTADALVSFLTPVLKGFGTDRGFYTAVNMQQVLGGHGYVTEWGLEQCVRDARVAMIYEGANGVQAMDLAGRKLARDGGQVAETYFTLIERECDAADASLGFITEPLSEAVQDLRDSAQWLVKNAGADPNNLGAGSFAFMQLVGIVSIGLMWLRIASVAQAKLAAGEGDQAFYEAKLAVAHHYARRGLAEVPMLKRQVQAGAETLMALPAEAFEITV